MRNVALALVGAVAVLALGCSAAPGKGAAPHTEVPPIVREAMQRPSASRSSLPPQIARERACGAVALVDKLAHNAIAAEAEPGNPAPPQDGKALTQLAESLQTMDRGGLPKALQAAITAYAMSLSDQGAAISRNRDRQTHIVFSSVLLATGDTVRALCDV